MKYYSLKELNILRRNNKILLVKFSIYDVSEYYKIHPGGYNAIINNLNGDVTKHYNFHSKNAKKVWDKYKIGELKRNDCNIL